MSKFPIMSKSPHYRGRGSPGVDNQIFVSGGKRDSDWSKVSHPGMIYVIGALPFFPEF